MTNIKSLLTSLFAHSIADSFPTLENVPILVQAAQSEKFGDYQCNSAMAIAKVLIVILGRNCFR